MRPLTLALPLLLAAACSSAPAPTTPTGNTDERSPVAVLEPLASAAAAPADGSAVRAPLDSVLCYAGSQRITLASGGSEPGARTLLRRRMRPGESQIVEEVVRYDPLPEVPPRRSTVVYSVDGDAFALAESRGAYSGSGTLSGASWQWSSWQASYELPSGIRVESTSSVAADGVLSTDQQVYAPDGQRVMTIHETGEPLPRTECDERFATVPEAAAASSGGRSGGRGRR